MSKKDYEAIALAIRQVRTGLCQSSRERAVATAITERLARYFESQNKRFDRERWLNACMPNLPEGTCGATIAPGHSCTRPSGHGGDCDI